jgi:hypothetical protein
MAGPEDSQQHLDDHYGDVVWKIVPEPGKGDGMSSKEAGAFLRGLRPVARAAQSLKEAAKKVSGKA